MEYQVKYIGSMYSREGVIYTAEIMELTDEAPTVEELRFPGDEPIVIDREEKGKEEPIQGSICTLKVISPGDRTYENLYTITPGKIALRLKRDGKVWWIGCLDPEFYEEPYISLGDYEVSMTFSDFGILKRKKMSLGGSIREMLVYVFGSCGLGELPIETSLVTTTLEDGQTNVIDGLSVERENWTDEDGEDCTMEDALKSILQSLSLKMIQRGGKIWVYDLNGLYTLGESRQVKWMSDDQILGVDKVVNKVKVTFSPYCQSKVSTDMAYTDTPRKNCLREMDIPKTSYNYNLEVKNYEVGKLFFTYWNSDNENQPNTLKSYHSFTMFLGRKGVGIGISALDEHALLYHIDPIYDGEEEDGIVVACPYIGAIQGDGTHTDATKWYAETWLHAVDGATRPCWMLDWPWLITWHDIAIQPLHAAEAEKLRLKLNVSLLISTRYNPFVDPEEGYGNGFNNNAKDEDVVMACMEVNITAIDSNGQQAQIFNGPFLRHEKDISGSCKGWETYNSTTSGDDAHLTFYNASDKDGSVMNQWTKCRQPSSCWYETRNKAMSMLDDGMYIDYPVSTDESKIVAIRIKVRPGMMLFKKGFSQATDDLNHLSTAANMTKVDHFNVKWMLLKDFGLSVVSSRDKMEELDSDDVTYYGYANKEAADDLEIDTMTGTLEDIVVTSKGTFRKTADGSFVQRLQRSGRTDTAEQLLIGTLQSQFCDRRTKLSGTEEETGEGLKAITEAAQGDKRFVLLGETIDVKEDLNNVSMAELRPDEHEINSETEAS